MRKLANVKTNNCVPANNYLWNCIIMPKKIWVLSSVREFELLLWNSNTSTVFNVLKARWERSIWVFSSITIIILFNYDYYYYYQFLLLLLLSSSPHLRVSFFLWIKRKSHGMQLTIQLIPTLWYHTLPPWSWFFKAINWLWGASFC